MLTNAESPAPRYVEAGQLPVVSSSQARGIHPLKLLRQGFALNPLLTIAGLVMLATLVATTLGLILDHREITGAPAWLKPTKFAISLSIYCFTLLWLLSFIRRWRRLVAVIAIATALGAFSEMALILVQVARGVSSHFNLTTPFDAAVYSTMGGFAGLVWTVGFLAAILLLFERLADPALAWGLRLGLLVCLTGMLVGVLMTQPSALQLAAMQAGQHLSIIGAHSVGVPDGGPGLPFVGWSTTGGDLRIPHFVGLHALQVLPFLGWFLSAARFPWLRSGHRVALVWVAGLGYLGMVGLLTWQALRGQSIIAPDTLTWEAWGTLVGLVLAAVVTIGIHARLRAVPSLQGA
jgi:hypothetical protein